MELQCKDFDLKEMESIKTVLIKCILKKLKFNPDHYKNLFVRHDLLQENLNTFSSNLEALLKKKTEAKGKDKGNFSFYSDITWQPQGDLNIIAWTKKWYAETRKVVDALKTAISWQQTVSAIQGFSGVGPFISQAAACSLVYGAMGGNFQKGDVFTKASEVKESINTWVHYGKGPEKSLAMLGVSQDLDGIKHLHSQHEKELEALKFPFLKSSDDSRRLLSLLDIEHMLCEWTHLVTKSISVNEKPAASCNLQHVKLDLGHL